MFPVVHVPLEIGKAVNFVLPFLLVIPWPETLEMPKRSRHEDPNRKTIHDQHWSRMVTRIVATMFHAAQSVLLARLGVRGPQRLLLANAVQTLRHFGRIGVSSLAQAELLGRIQVSSLTQEELWGRIWLSSLAQEELMGWIGVSSLAQEELWGRIWLSSMAQEELMGRIWLSSLDQKELFGRIWALGLDQEELLEELLGWSWVSSLAQEELWGRI